MFIFTLLITLLPYLCFAQVNIEKERAKKDQPVVAQVLVSHSSTRGNVNVSQLSTSGRIDYTQDTVHSFLIASYMSSEDNGNKLQQEAFGHARFTYMPKSVGLDLFVQTEYNPFKALEIRQLVGAYGRIELSSVGIFALGLGIMADYESLSKGNSDGLVPRGTSYMSYMYDTGSYKLSFTGYYQPKLFSFTDYRLTAEAYLEVRLSKFISLVEQFTYSYDSAPPVGVIVDDRRNTTSVKLSW